MQSVKKKKKNGLWFVFYARYEIVTMISHYGLTPRAEYEGLQAPHG
jgi:hypothetical protein